MASGNFSLNINSGTGASLEAPVSVNAHDNDGPNYGRESRTKTYTIKTYSDAGMLNQLNSQSFTVSHNSANYLILIAGVSTNDPSSNTSVYSNITKSIPTSQATVPISNPNGDPYYVYGITNARYIRFTASNATVSSFKYCTSLSSSWTTVSPSSGYVGPSSADLGKTDTYYFCFTVTPTSSSTVQFWAGTATNSTSSNSGNVYTISTLESGDIVFNPATVTISALGDSPQVIITNTTSTAATVSSGVSSGSTYFNSVSGSVGANNGSERFTISGTTPNYNTMTVGGKDFLVTPTSSEKNTGYIKAEGGVTRTCTVVQPGVTIDDDSSVFTIFDRNNAAITTNIISLPEGTTHLNFTSKAFIKVNNTVDSTGKYVWIKNTNSPLPAGITAITPSNTDQRISITVTDALGTRPADAVELSFSWVGCDGTANGTAWNGTAATHAKTKIIKVCREPGGMSASYTLGIDSMGTIDGSGQTRQVSVTLEFDPTVYSSTDPSTIQELNTDLGTMFLTTGQSSPLKFRVSNQASVDNDNSHVDFYVSSYSITQPQGPEGTLHVNVTFMASGTNIQFNNAYWARLVYSGAYLGSFQVDETVKHQDA